MTLVTVIFLKLSDSGVLIHDEKSRNFELGEWKRFDKLRIAVLKALEIPLNTPLWPYRQGVARQHVDVDDLKRDIEIHRELRLQALSHEVEEQRFGNEVKLKTTMQKWYNRLGKPFKRDGSAYISLTVETDEGTWYPQYHRLVNLVNVRGERLRRLFKADEDITDAVQQPLADALAALLHKSPRCLLGNVLEARRLDQLLSERIRGRRPLFGPYRPKIITTLQEFLKSPGVLLPDDWREVLSAVQKLADLKIASYKLGYYQVRLLIAELQGWRLKSEVLELTNELNSILWTMRDDPNQERRIAIKRALTKANPTSDLQKQIQGFLGSVDRAACAGCGCQK